MDMILCFGKEQRIIDIWHLPLYDQNNEWRCHQGKREGPSLERPDQSFEHMDLYRG